MDGESFRREWHAYYTEKRITHQWLQVHLLRDLPVRRVVEIGPISAWSPLCWRMRATR